MTDDPTAAAFARVFLALRALRDATVAARLSPDDDTEWLAHMVAADAEIDALRVVLTGDVPEPEPRPFIVPVFGAPEGDGVVFSDD